MTRKNTKNAPIRPDLYAPVWVSRAQLPRNPHDEILPGLFMGGTDDANVVYEAAGRSFDDNHSEFDAVATLYAHAQPVGWNVEEMRLGIWDSALDPANVDRVLRMAQWVHARWTAGDRVLVRCQAGMNRSGLVTALVLMLAGRSADEAITLIRERRAPVCLFNDDFVEWLVLEAPSLVAPHSVPSLRRPRRERRFSHPRSRRVSIVSMKVKASTLARSSLVSAL